MVDVPRFVSCTYSRKMNTNILDIDNINTNDLLPASDEELDQELTKFAESLFEMGRNIPIANCGTYPDPCLEDESFLKIYQDIGQKNQMSAETVRDYIRITRDAMLKCADSEMREYMCKVLSEARNRVCEVPTVEDYILFMYSMLLRTERLLKKIKNE